MVDTPVKLAILISGSGSNLQALIDACASPDFPARIAVVLSNKADAYGLERARAADIPTAVISHKDADFEDKILETLGPYDPDIMCLAGFMRILSADFITRFGKPMINIHPSLLPKYKGLNTHQRAINAGEREAGCTVHHVVPEMDSGEIIVQKRVPVLEGDTAETLAARILEQEHKAYPQAVEKLVQSLHNS